jgi:ribosomal protein S17
LGCQIGDKVQICESRPYSAQVHFVVEMIIKREAEVVVAATEQGA